MAVQRRVTCQSLDLGLQMVENQYSACSASEIDDAIADP